MSISYCILQDVLEPLSGRAPCLQPMSGSLGFHRSGRSASSLLIASLMLGVSGAAALASDDSQSNSKSGQASTKSASDSKIDPSTKKSASEEAMAKKLAAMERRMQSLEIEVKLKDAQAARAGRSLDSRLLGAQASDVASPSKDNGLFGVAPSPVPEFKIGSYGEIKFGSQQNPAANGQWQNGFDMARLVLLPTYQVTDNIVFNAEIEFEHSGTGFDNDDKLHGTAEIEQAFFDYKINDHLTVRSPGVDIVPISFNNLYHEPTLFYSVERPELANGLIPSTWAAPATGVYGKIVDGLNYQFQISQSAEDFGDDFAHRGDNGAPIPGGYAPGVDGLNALAFSHAPLGNFTQMSNQVAFTGRLSYTPSFIPGFAGSSAVYYSPNITVRGAYGDDGRLLGNNAMTIFDTEARYRVPNTGLELRGEYVYVNFSNPENLRANNDSDPTNNVGKDMYGYSGEIAYHIKTGTFLGSDWELVPFYRYTHQNLQTGGLFGIDPDGITGHGEQTFHDFGIAMFPSPNLVFKLDYTKIVDNSAAGAQSDRILGGVGWLW
jgi:Phosphate-selective porin O and P